MGAKPDPRTLDFLSLETLQLVHQLGSFTAAAERLDVNQSAVSYTISKLRKAFGDPLFVREAGKQAATERCRQLLEASGQILDLLEHMAQPAEFDPREPGQSVTIACNYYERILLIPAILAEIRRQSDSLQVKIINAFAEGHSLLLNRQADMLIGPFARTETGFQSRLLLVEHYACLMDPAHAFAAKPVGLDDYLAFQHVLINYGGNWKSAYLEELEAAKLSITPALTVPSPAGLPELISGSNLVATIPSRLGRKIAGGLTLMDCPVRSRFRLSLVWASSTHMSPKHIWLREIIHNVSSTFRS